MFIFYLHIMNYNFAMVEDVIEENIGLQQT